MTDQPRLITTFPDCKPFAVAANARQYAHPQPRRSIWRVVFGWLV